jgi:hypothetical protein
MTMFMRLLRTAAQKHGLCIIVGVPLPLLLSSFYQGSREASADEEVGPPQVLNDATGAGRPALGASFTFMSDATLWLTRSSGKDRELRTAEVLRSRISVRNLFPPVL